MNGTTNAGQSLDFRNINSLWCSVWVETLVRRGVSQAVISPGSRSTPLTMALARHPGIVATPVLDERSAAFFALGVAKAAREPVVLVCTSGSAGANYFPAIIEAQESGVPLIVITADRPPEMRDCGSGQTIDQQKLFGGYTVFYHEMAVPEARLELLAYLRQTVSHAVDRARCDGGRGGVVHLNAPFRDPLPPLPESERADAMAVAALQEAHRTRGVLGEAFFGALDGWERRADFYQPQLWRPGHGERALIVAGPEPETDGYALRSIAERLQVPVLLDVLSPLRQQAPEEWASEYGVAGYDIILRNVRAAEALQPDRVLCVGGWPTSKVLREWLERCAPAITLLTRDGHNRDALHGNTTVLAGTLASMDSPELEACEGAADYLARWRQAEEAVQGELRAVFADRGGKGLELNDLFEGRVAWLLHQALPEGTPLMVANSMPVRDIEYFWPSSNRGLTVFYNRGANGIDGTLSTALGVAHGHHRPAVLLTGDLALLHDTNGFLLAASGRMRVQASLTIVLVNNNGGGIFEHLPVAVFDPPFEDYWATPQRADFAKLCAAYGVEHVTVRDGEHFTALVSELPGKGVRVLEVRTERKRDTACRKALLAAVAAHAWNEK